MLAEVELRMLLAIAAVGGSYDEVSFDGGRWQRGIITTFIRSRLQQQKVERLSNTGTPR